MGVQIGIRHGVRFALNNLVFNKIVQSLWIYNLCLATCGNICVPLAALQQNSTTPLRDFKLVN